MSKSTILLKYRLPACLLLLQLLIAGCGFQDSSTNVLLRQSQKQENSNQLSNSQNTLNQALNTVPLSNYNLRLYIVMCRLRVSLRQGQYQAVLDLCPQAQKLATEAFRSHSRLSSSIVLLQACALAGLGRNGQSVELCKQLIAQLKAEPDFLPLRIVPPLLLLADSERKQGNIPAAVSDYREIAEIDQSDYMFEIVNYRLALCYAMLNQPTQAESYFDTCVAAIAFGSAGDLDPDTRHVIFEYISYLKRLGKFSKADQIEKQEIQLRSANQRYLEWLSARTDLNSRYRLLQRRAEGGFQ